MCMCACVYSSDGNSGMQNEYLAIYSVKAILNNLMRKY